MWFNFFNTSISEKSNSSSFGDLSELSSITLIATFSSMIIDDEYLFFHDKPYKLWKSSLDPAYHNIWKDSYLFFLSIFARPYPSYFILNQILYAANIIAIYHPSDYSPKQLKYHLIFLHILFINSISS